MQNLRSEILTLLSYRGIVSRQKAFWLMYQHRWAKRKIVEVLAHSLVYYYEKSLFSEGTPYKKHTKATIKKMAISALSKRKMRPRYLYGNLMIPSNINKKRAKNALLLHNDCDFMYFISDLIVNNNLFNQL
jgi:hypothetical protein